MAVRLTPGARREGVIGFETENGPCRVAVTAPPVEGQANATLLKLLARQWRVSKSSLSIVAGAAARDKIVHVAGEPASLAARLAEWRERNHG